MPQHFSILGYPRRLERHPDFSLSAGAESPEILDPRPLAAVSSSHERPTVKPQRLLRHLARMLPLFALSLALPNAALSQPVASNPPELTPEARARLAQAAEDTRVTPWQREFMQRLARSGTATALDPSSATPSAMAGTAADDGAWTEGGSLPNARYAHTAIYDPVRDRMLIFGGRYNGDYDNSSYDFNNVWVLSLAGSPVWAPLNPSGTPPTSRMGHTVVYDPVRDRMVVFGGISGSSYSNDVWALTLAGSPAWAQLTPSGTPPSARYGHSAIYDPVRDRMVVFGGYLGSYSFLGDTWALSLLDSPTWTQLTPSGAPPSARYGHSAIYDPVRDRMVVFGGCYTDMFWGPTYFEDVQALSLSGTPAWTQLNPTGSFPGGRTDHSAIYDPVRDRMVVFAGFYSITGWGGDPATLYYLNDTVALSLSGTPVWTQLSSEGPFYPRDEHSAIYDPVRDRMVVFGGRYYDGTPYLSFNEIWALSLAGTPAWTQLTPIGPYPRRSQSAIYDPVRGRMIVFGGYPGSGNDVWALSLSGTPAWTQLTPTGTPPSGRYYHSAIYVPVGDYMVVFGGWSSGYRNDVWALVLTGTPAWVKLAPVGAPPGRADHTAVYDPVRNRMVVFGGWNGTVSFNDSWALSLGITPTWTQLTPSGTVPSARSTHSAIYDPMRDRMVVFGGYSSVYCNDVWALSLSDATAWAQLTPSGTLPSARADHSAIYDPVRDRMVIFAGSSPGDPGYLNDVWALSLADTPAWTMLAPAGTAPVRRSGHSAIYDPERDRMLTFGGEGSGYRNDVWVLTWGGSPTYRAWSPAGMNVEVALGPQTALTFGDVTAPGPTSLIVENTGPAVPSGMTPVGSAATYYELSTTATFSGTVTVRMTYDASGGIVDPSRIALMHYDTTLLPAAWVDITTGRDTASCEVWGVTSTLSPFMVMEPAAVGGVDEPVPVTSAFVACAPNPTRGPTAVSYSLKQAGRVQLGIYDVTGRLVRRLVDGERPAGAGTVVWNGTDESGARLGAGMYFIRLAGPGIRQTRKVILVR